MTKWLLLFALGVLAGCAPGADDESSSGVGPDDQPGGSGSLGTLVVEAPSPALGADGKLTEAVGFETLGGVFTPLLAAGCALPCSEIQEFSTAEDNQEHLELRLFRGSCEDVAECHALGTYRITGFPIKPRGYPQIIVSLGADEGRLTLSARGVGRALRIQRVAP